MFGIHVVLGQALADFNDRIADNRVLRGVVCRLPPKHRGSDASLFQRIVVSREGRLHHEPQQRYAALTVPEVGTLQDLRQLRVYGRVVVTQVDNEASGICIRGSHDCLACVDSIMCGRTVRSARRSLPPLFKSLELKAILQYQHSTVP